jgi:hypothetical protein
VPVIAGFPTSAVCITGAHRSGTSMLAQLLHACGVYLGPESELMEPSYDNAEGFWEHLGFVRLNDEILQHFGGSWDLPPSVHLQRDSSDFRRFDENARTLIATMRESSPWGWKDPRNCLTLPFWREVIPELRIVAIIRHPLEVAASLHARNGISRALACHLWQTYNAPLLTSPADETILVTHYNSFFEDARAEVARVLAHLAIPLPEKGDRLDAIVSALHRHHSATARQVAEAHIPAAVLELYYALMARSSQRPEDEFKPTRKRELAKSRLPEVDLIASDKAVALLRAEAEQRTAWAQESSEEIDRLRRIIAELQAALEERTLWAQQQEVELKRATAVLADLQAQLADRTAWARALDTELNNTRSTVAELQQQLAERTAWAQESDRERAEAVAAWAELRVAYDEGNALVQQLVNEQQQARALIVQLQSELQKASATSA